MRKIAVILAALLVGVPALFAQNPFNYAGRWNFSVQGGAAVTLSENAFSYTDRHKAAELLKLQGSAAIGYDFNSRFGIRVAGGYAQHASAANSYESGGGFYPYQYQSVSAFADAVFHLNGMTEHYKAFAPSFYAGLGGARTFGFTNPNHPFQTPKDKDTVIGMRIGAILEIDFTSGLGIFCDLGLEAYDDWHNGLRPNAVDQSYVKGYAGFPFDLVGKASLGIIYHFK